MNLLIAIPALNEEGAIQSIIERTLAARDYIIENSNVTGVSITVVSDGSTDGTVALASQYTGRINLIVFEKNRGYGAAIKEAWSQSDAELLAFLDADGTCDPKFFVKLCNAVERENADVVLGCRLNPESQMPLVRRVGNTLFAILLNIVSSKRVKDTASGMRVVRRSSLEHLYPLPDGLHFTPAMSARALLSRSVRIVEVNMPYHERTGQSKLRVIKDGLRFLKVILETAFLYRPSRLLDLGAFLLWLAAAALMVQPVLYYLSHRSVAEWLIYRFIVSQLLATAAVLLWSISYLAFRMVGISLGGEAYERSLTWRTKIFHGSMIWVVSAGLLVVGAALVYQGFLELVTSGSVYEHWSRFIVTSFCVLVAIILVVTRAADYVLQLVESRLRYLRTASVKPDASPNRREVMERLP